MAAVLPLRLTHVPVLRAYDSTGVALPRRHWELDQLIRLASAGVIVSGVAFAAVGLALYAGIPGSRYLPLAVAATVVALTLHVRHLRHALAGHRAPADGWTLAILALVIVAPTPLIGAAWLQMFHVLAASAFLVLRPRWAVPCYLGIAAGTAAWAAAAFPDALVGPTIGVAAWFGLSVVIRGLVPIVIVWLVAALRELDSARQALASEAVATERQRIADEFKRSVGHELESLVARGTRSGELLATNPAVAGQELGLLVDQSRRTLSTARRLLHRYTLPARAELETAEALLRAAGIDATVDVPEDELPTTLDGPTRTSLRRLTDELLRGDPGGPVVITLGPDGGGLHVERDRVR
jgi:signal transduction histidine kinase